MRTSNGFLVNVSGSRLEQLVKVLPTGFEFERMMSPRFNNTEASSSALPVAICAEPGEV